MSRSLLAAAAAAGPGVGPGIAATAAARAESVFRSGLAANAGTTAAPIASAITPAASLKTDMTTHPAAPVASETLSGVLGISRGGATKGSLPAGGFSRHFPAKMPHSAQMAGKSAAAGGAKAAGTGAPARGYGHKPPKPQPGARLPWPDVKPVETTTTRRFR